MKATTNKVIVKLEKQTEDTIIIAGKELFLDTEFNQMRHARQYGIVVAEPMSVTKREEDGITLKKGDKVYFHHFAIHPDHVMYHDGTLLNILDYDMVYCVVRDGEIIMLQDYVFVYPVETERVSKILYGFEKSKYEPTKGEVAHVGLAGIQQGLTEGDIIEFSKNSDYDMIVEGKMLYRMRLQDIYMVYEKAV